MSSTKPTEQAEPQMTLEDQYEQLGEEGLRNSVDRNDHINDLQENGIGGVILEAPDFCIVPMGYLRKIREAFSGDDYILARAMLFGFYQLSSYMGFYSTGDNWDVTCIQDLSETIGLPEEKILPMLLVMKSMNIFNDTKISMSREEAQVIRERLYEERRTKIEEEKAYLRAKRLRELEEYRENRAKKLVEKSRQGQEVVQ